ncbi:hypothetical protein PRIPAC_72194 [Pristionchus pacificus]|uniref:Uncharacterized protein n=1 Tax=Pristionchus pacificus TaxID=54126 RepID=A0A2A6CRR8_PRIPA|nr:hypothetical protein PRIPAC_72194 [Pristionchus pacificus]|eukprot:PDM80786.1 hypothetical protein PRIPAC_35789 [Pristionchus pacificus]
MHFQSDWTTTDMMIEKGQRMEEGREWSLIVKGEEEGKRERMCQYFPSIPYLRKVWRNESFEEEEEEEK